MTNLEIGLETLKEQFEKAKGYSVSQKMKLYGKLEILIFKALQENESVIAATAQDLQIDLINMIEQKA